MKAHISDLLMPQYLTRLRRGRGGKIRTGDLSSNVLLTLEGQSRQMRTQRIPFRKRMNKRPFDRFLMGYTHNFLVKLTFQQKLRTSNFILKQSRALFWPGDDPSELRHYQSIQDFVVFRSTVDSNKFFELKSID